MIRRADGAERTDLGGVLYTAVALAQLDPQARVFLMGRVGIDAVGAVRSLAEEVPSLRMDGMVAISSANYRCILQYAEDGSKVEHLRGWLGPLSWDEAQRTPAPLDALLINFITGHELELDVLRRLRSRVAGPVVMDLHSLLLRTAADGRRGFYRPPAWREWVSGADVVQMNEAEAGVLGGLSKPSTQDLLSFATQLLGLGPRLVVITRGRWGALAASAVGSGHTCHLSRVPSVGIQMRDTTGCGDVLLAALALGVMRGTEPQELLDGACLAATLAGSVQGPAALDVLVDARWH